MRPPSRFVSDIPRRRFLEVGLKGGLAIAALPAAIDRLFAAGTPGAAGDPAVQADPAMLDRVIRKALEKGGDFADVYLETRTARSLLMEEYRFKSAELGISRTPLREALKVLAVEGLVTMKPRRGAYVAETSRDDVAQVYHLLALLESDAAAEVARKATDAQIAELKALHDRLERQLRQRDAFFATNEAFHLKLLEIAGNRWRQQIVSDLRKIMKINRHHSLFKQGRLEDSLAEHRALMAAPAARDARQVARLMKSHFANALEASV